MLSRGNKHHYEGQIYAIWLPMGCQIVIANSAGGQLYETQSMRVSQKSSRPVTVSTLSINCQTGLVHASSLYIINPLMRIAALLHIRFHLHIVVKYSPYGFPVFTELYFYCIFTLRCNTVLCE